MQMQPFPPINQNDWMARQVIDTLTLMPEQPQTLTTQEKMHLYFFLSAAELYSDKRKSEYEIIENENVLQLKKIHVYEEGDQYSSFNFSPNNHHNISTIDIDQPQIQELEQQKQFSSLEEIKRYVELNYMIRSKQHLLINDEITGNDNSIILQLNLMIQQNQIEPQQLIQISQQILFSEAQLKQFNRYSQLMGSLCKIIKSLLEILQNKGINFGESQTIVKFFESLPKYTPQSFELLKQICELNQDKDVFNIYFDCFKRLISSLQKFTQQDESFRQQYEISVQQFIKLNHRGVHEFFKMPEFQKNEEKLIWDLMYPEAIDKVDKIQTHKDRDSCLTFIFYMGVKQIQLTKQASVFSKLMNSLPTLPQNISQEVYPKLLRIKESFQIENQRGVMNMVIVMKMIQKTVSNWEKQYIRIIVSYGIQFFKLLFIQFLLLAKSINQEGSHLLIAAFITKYVSQTIEDSRAEVENTYQQIMQQTFRVECSQVANQVALTLPLHIIIKMLNEEIYFLRKLLYEDPERDVAHTLFVRFIKESQKDLQQVIECFFQLINSPKQVRRVLQELINLKKPQGIFMVIVLKMSNEQCQYEEEVLGILQYNWKDNSNFRSGLIKYFIQFPNAKEKIVPRLDTQSRNLLQQMNLVK